MPVWPDIIEPAGSPEHLAINCDKIADFYEESPGMVWPPAVIGLYRAVAELARMVAEKDTNSCR